MWTVSHSHRLISIAHLSLQNSHRNTLLSSPPFDLFARPHWNLHIFRVTPEERLNARCPDGMLNPFICKDPPFEQPTPEGRAFYVWGKNANNSIANVPDTFEDGIDAVPGEAVHTFDRDASAPVADWFDPQLIMGLYNGKYIISLSG